MDKPDALADKKRKRGCPKKVQTQNDQQPASGPEIHSQAGRSDSSAQGSKSDEFTHSSSVKQSEDPPDLSKDIIDLQSDSESGPDVDDNDISSKTRQPEFIITRELIQ
ncbi:hypothetical protein QAD02_022740 [Eretmocerus hayati]|uniref:Uncharacterized protein n=1 Tax=Eretmocerus hayati TaxID=131215 RepID=A0ACC2PTU8_9HYME|nr:hypothetical protein QAD02_022740 [Eretmocerus hayati]